MLHGALKEYMCLSSIGKFSPSTIVHGEYEYFIS
jgi:hypothetical protein